LAKISSAGLRAPGPFEGLNVNFCKNTKCANFGVPETPHRIKLAHGAAPQPGDYSLMAAGKGKPQLKCLLCGESMPMRSNHGIVEELDQLMGYLRETDDPACPNEGCSLFTVPLSLAGQAYVQRGKTAAGTQRYRCNACKKTFSGAGKSTKKHRLPHKNRDVFALLISKMPIRRMAWYTGMDRQSLYGKIDFVHRQCQAFAGARERGLLDGSLAYT
jgi:transposase-like protein